MIEPLDLSVLHIGAGRYDPDDRSHATYAIWSELAKGFARYTVVGRSIHSRASSFEDGNLSVRLLSSSIASEAEFLITQYRAMAIAGSVKPDVIVTQCPVLGGLVAGRIASRYGARILMEFHMAHYFERHFRPSRNGLLRCLTRYSLPRANRIRVLSKTMKQELADVYGAGYAVRTVVLPPRVDLSRFAAVKEDWAINGLPRIVIVGSVNQRKGQYRLIEAVIANKIDCEFWLVGTGPDSEACKALATRAGIGERMREFGYLTHNSLAALLPTADVLVSFSNMEGTPRAIMEGMAVGLPIVTTDAGYCADVVEHGVSGIVLGGEPSVEIGATLRRLFGDRALRARLGRAARARAEIEFDSVKVYQRYRTLIAETERAQSVQL